MQLRGTGNAPEGQYPKGQIVDAREDDAADLVEKGWVTVVPADEDPGRTPIGIAQGIIRGDTLNHPDDAAAAAGFQGKGENPDAGKDPYAVVTEQDPEAGGEYSDEGDVTPALPPEDDGEGVADHHGDENNTPVKEPGTTDASDNGDGTGDPIDYSDTSAYSAEDLEKLVSDRGLDVKGTGTGGNVVRADREKALTDADADVSKAGASA